MDKYQTMADKLEHLLIHSGISVPCEHCSTCSFPNFIFDDNDGLYIEEDCYCKGKNKRKIEVYEIAEKLRYSKVFYDYVNNLLGNKFLYFKVS
jgi:hypothetical protein